MLGVQTGMGLAEPSLPEKPTPVRESGIFFSTLDTNLPLRRLPDAIARRVSKSLFELPSRV